jgi:hypothetical protein
VGKTFVLRKKEVKFLRQTAQNTLSQTLVMVSAERANHLRRPWPAAAILIVVSVEVVAGIVSI